MKIQNAVIILIQECQSASQSHSDVLILPY